MSHPATLGVLALEMQATSDFVNGPQGSSAASDGIYPVTNGVMHVNFDSKVAAPIRMGAPTLGVYSLMQSRGVGWAESQGKLGFHQESEPGSLGCLYIT